MSDVGDLTEIILTFIISIVLNFRKVLSLFFWSASFLTSLSVTSLNHLCNSMSFSLRLIMFKIPMSFSCAFVQRYPSPIWSYTRLVFWLHSSLFILDFISL